MATDDPAARWPHYREDDFIIRNFAFKSGEVLPALRLHYRTMGVPRRDAAGKIVNGVLLLQGNTGTGANWLRPSRYCLQRERCLPSGECHAGRSQSRSKRDHALLGSLSLPSRRLGCLCLSERGEYPQL